MLPSVSPASVEVKSPRLHATRKNQALARREITNAANDASGPKPPPLSKSDTPLAG